MPTHLLLAPAASGKTEYCLAQIQTLRRENPLAPIWVVLPNAANAQAFMRRLALNGGALGVNAVTFYALYEELLARAGQLVARLDDAVLYRLLRESAVKVHDVGALKFFGEIHTTPGFTRAAHNTIQELKRARITTEQFTDFAATRGARLQELARLYAAYQRWLIQSSWADGEGQGWLAALALEKDAALASDWRLLVVDGFDEFNPTQLEVLRLLAARVQETLITLTGDESKERLAHRRFLRAHRALQDRLPHEPIALENRTRINADEHGIRPNPSAFIRENPDASSRILPEGRAVRDDASPRPNRFFSLLEAALFESIPQKIPPNGALEFLQASTRAEEVRAALRWLKARIVRDGFAVDEVALLARDVEPYRALIEETAAEFGMPVHLPQGAQLATNPAIAALLNLLAIPLQDFPRRRVVEAWRSPYFDWSAWGIARGDAERLDAAARWGQVVEGRAQWDETLTRLARVPEESDLLENDDAPITAPRGARAGALLQKFRAFAARVTMPSAAPLREYAAWLEELIGQDPELLTEYQRESDNSVRLVRCARQNELTRERDVAALGEFKNALRGLVFAELATRATRGDVPQGDVPAERLYTYGEFWNELRGAVQAAGYRVPPPEENGTILVAPALAARGLSFRAVALVGLAEGEFPRALSEDPLVFEDERAALGLPPRLAGDEVTFFYEAVTRAREKLLLTRPCLAPDGAEWEPSPFWEQLVRIVDTEPRTIHPGDALELQDAASATELVTLTCGHSQRMFRQTTSWRQSSDRMSLLASDVAVADADIRARLEAVQHGANILAARTAARARGEFDGDLTALQTRLAQDFSPERPWSASRLEAYGACPFAFFTAHALGLEARAPIEAGYDVRQLGTMYHAILEKLFADAQDTTDLNALLAALPKVARAIFDAAPEQYGFRPTALWQQQRAELEGILADTLRALAEESAGWQPAQFERAFGRGDAPPLLLRDAEGNSIQVRGYIDRIDVNGAGELRVIDYKSSATPIAKTELDAGKRLQLALYALAARDALKLGEPVAGMYWHINGGKSSTLKLETYQDGIADALRVAVAHTLSHAARVARGEFAPRPPRGGCPEWCPASAFCWRYVPQQH